MFGIKIIVMLARSVCVVLVMSLSFAPMNVIWPAQAESAPQTGSHAEVGISTSGYRLDDITGLDRKSIAPLGAAQAMTYTAYLPVISKPPYTCPTTSSAAYEAIAFLGSPYKNNTITDENADFRLSILGYAATNATLDYVSYGGGTGDGDGPQFADIFTPKRKPAFVKAYQVYQWNWNDGPGSVPPYGSRGAVNTQWPVTVLDLGTTPGELLNIPYRTATNAPPDYRALVLYAGPNELTVVYLLQDQVVVNGTGYVVHMLNFCVDPNLLSLYRAQLSNGYRSTMKLPAIRNYQAVGTALGNSVTVAVRDGGAFMDPRVKTDWWYDAP